MPNDTPPMTTAVPEDYRRSKTLLLSHASLLLLCAWLSLFAVRGRLGGGASGAARAWPRKDQPLLAALLEAGAAGSSAAPWLRGSAWEFPVPPELLDRGVVSEGDPAAAARLAAKLLARQPISVAALGGSLTFGKGASSPGRTDWVSLLAAWLQDSFPTGASGGNGSAAGGHVMVNAAVAASPSEYISFCLHQHLDTEHPPDLVLVDYSVNDGLRPWHDAHRLSLERLLRRLLALPGAPLVALLMMHSYRPAQTNRTFHRSGEEKLGSLALYYGLPWLSMRSVVHHKLVAGEDGFRRDQWLADDTHPNDRGHTYVAQLVTRFLLRVVAREAAAQLQRSRAAHDGAAPAAVARWLGRPGRKRAMRQGSLPAVQLPPPMLPGAEPLLAEACVQGPALQAAVVPGSMRGFAWEVGGRREAPEVHATTNSSGSELTLLLDTDVALAPGSGVQQPNATHVGLLLWYTHSRYKVGDGQATCGGGCACQPQLLRTALRRPYGTQDHLWLVLATRSPACRLTVRTLNTTETVGHVFRLRGVLVSAAAAVRVPAEFTLGENLDAELPVAT